MTKDYFERKKFKQLRDINLLLLCAIRRAREIDISLPPITSHTVECRMQKSCSGPLRSNKAKIKRPVLSEGCSKTIEI